MSLETSTCDKRNEKGMCLRTLVHPTGYGSSIPRTGVTEPLQSPLFIYNPNLEQCASWRLLIYKQNIGMSLPKACFFLKCNTCHTFSEA